MESSFCEIITFVFLCNGDFFLWDLYFKNTFKKQQGSPVLCYVIIPHWEAKAALLKRKEHRPGVRIRGHPGIALLIRRLHKAISPLHFLSLKRKAPDPRSSFHPLPCDLWWPFSLKGEVRGSAGMLFVLGYRKVNGDWYSLNSSLPTLLKAIPAKWVSITSLSVEEIPYQNTVRNVAIRCSSLSQHLRHQ